MANVSEAVGSTTTIYGPPAPVIATVPPPTTADLLAAKGGIGSTAVTTTPSSPFTTTTVTTPVNYVYTPATPTTTYTTPTTTTTTTYTSPVQQQLAATEAAYVPPPIVYTQPYVPAPIVNYTPPQHTAGGTSSYSAPVVPVVVTPATNIPAFTTPTPSPVQQALAISEASRPVTVTTSAPITATTNSAFSNPYGITPPKLSNTNPVWTDIPLPPVPPPVTVTNKDGSTTTTTYSTNWAKFQADLSVSNPRDNKVYLTALGNGMTPEQAYQLTMAWANDTNTSITNANAVSDYNVDVQNAALAKFSPFATTGFNSRQGGMQYDPDQPGQVTTSYNLGAIVTSPTFTSNVAGGLKDLSTAGFSKGQVSNAINANLTAAIRANDSAQAMVDAPWYSKVAGLILGTGLGGGVAQQASTGVGFINPISLNGLGVGNWVNSWAGPTYGPAINNVVVPLVTSILLTGLTSGVVGKLGGPTVGEFASSQAGFIRFGEPDPLTAPKVPEAPTTPKIPDDPFNPYGPTGPNQPLPGPWRIPGVGPEVTGPIEVPVPDFPIEVPGSTPDIYAPITPYVPVLPVIPVVPGTPEVTTPSIPGVTFPVVPETVPTPTEVPIEAPTPEKLPEEVPVTITTTTPFTAPEITPEPDEKSVEPVVITTPIPVEVPIRAPDITTPIITTWNPADVDKVTVTKITTIAVPKTGDNTETSPETKTKPDDKIDTKTEVDTYTPTDTTPTNEDPNKPKVKPPVPIWLPDGKLNPGGGGGGSGRGMNALLTGKKWLRPQLNITIQNPLTGTRNVSTIVKKGQVSYGATVSTPTARRMKIKI